MNACKIFVTKEMLLLSFSIAYTGGCERPGVGVAPPSDWSFSPPPPGLALTFYSGVYGTCIGAMTQFGHDAKSLIGISGICIGVGEILGEAPGKAADGGTGNCRSVSWNHVRFSSV